MSWSIGLTAVSAIDAKAALESTASNVTPAIASYLKAGLSALQDRHTGDVLVTVLGHGHLCDGPSSYEVTSATLEVRQATAEEIAAKG